MTTKVKILDDLHTEFFYENARVCGGFRSCMQEYVFVPTSASQSFVLSKGSKKEEFLREWSNGNSFYGNDYNCPCTRIEVQKDYYDNALSYLIDQLDESLFNDEKSEAFETALADAKELSEGLIESADDLYSVWYALRDMKFDGTLASENVDDYEISTDEWGDTEITLKQ